MSVTVSNVQTNHRGVSASVTGDGATTTFTIPHGRFLRTGTAKAFVVTAHSGATFQRSERGGFPAPVDGTVNASTATVTGANFNVTTGAAIANGIVAHVVCLHDADSE